MVSGRASLVVNHILGLWDFFAQLTGAKDSAMGPKDGSGMTDSEWRTCLSDVRRRAEFTKNGLQVCFVFSHSWERDFLKLQQMLEYVEVLGIAFLDDNCAAPAEKLIAQLSAGDPLWKKVSVVQLDNAALENTFDLAVVL